MKKKLTLARARTRATANAAAPATAASAQASTRIPRPVLPLPIVPSDDSPVDHAELKYQGSTCDMGFLDEGSGETVTTTCVTVAGNYELEIKRSVGAGRSKPYSLYNLAIQGRFWEVTILRAKAEEGDVAILDGKGDTVDLPTEWTPILLPRVRPANLSARKSAQPFNEKQIHFVQFDGPSCKINVAVQSPRS